MSCDTQAGLRLPLVASFTTIAVVSVVSNVPLAVFPARTFG